MSFENALVVGGCVAVLAVVAMNLLNSASRRHMLHHERMTAIEKGVPLPEDLLTDAPAEGGHKDPHRNTALQGTILTALGLGMFAASRFVPMAGLDPDNRARLRAFFELWAYPATFVGVALLLFVLFSRERKS
jgi:hypothetical protein